jgi:hypothetical protein
MIKALIVGLSLALGAVVAAAQEAPVDFSGTWVLNTDEGQNLGMVAAVQETLVIRQSDATLDVDFTDVFQGNTTTRQTSYDLAGTPVTNFAAMGDESETVSRWEGDKLVTTWTSEGAIPGTQVVKIESRWLSADGNTLSVKTAREGRPAMILVYDRQE